MQDPSDTGLRHQRWPSSTAASFSCCALGNVAVVCRGALVLRNAQTLAEKNAEQKPDGCEQLTCACFSADGLYIAVGQAKSEVQHQCLLTAMDHHCFLGQERIQKTG